jgi:hypothetical protein
MIQEPVAEIGPLAMVFESAKKPKQNAYTSL